MMHTETRVTQQQEHRDNRLRIRALITNLRAITIITINIIITTTMQVRRIIMDMGMMRMVLVGHSSNINNNSINSSISNRIGVTRLEEEGMERTLYPIHLLLLRARA